MTDGETQARSAPDGETPAGRAAAKPLPPASADEELNEEDQRLQEQLATLVDVLAESDAQLHEQALNSLTTLIRTSTSSMTAVPKPLKFIKPHYPRVAATWEAWPAGELKTRLAGILSVLGMTQGTALEYRLKAGASDAAELAAWGHDYLRHLALEIGSEFHRRVEAADDDAMDVDDRHQDLLSLALRIVPYFLAHNAETDAVDLLLEVESVERLAELAFVDAESQQRVCQYLVACAAYLDSETASAALATAFSLYKKSGDAPQALLLAVRLDEPALVRAVFADCHDASVRKQLALILARQRRFYDLGDVAPELADLANNTQLARYFAYLVKELNLEKPKLPAETLGGGEGSFFKAYGERAKMNLVSIFVRGFMNAGFCNLGDGFDEFMAVSSRTRNVCAAAVHSSIGLGYLWNYGAVLEQLDAYTDPEIEAVARAGAVLGVGVGTTGVHDETDAALGVLADYIAHGDARASSLLTSAILSLGFAYAGTARPDLLDLLAPFVADVQVPLEVAALAALALGLVFVGTANGELTQTVLEACIERPKSDLAHGWAPFLGLGLALLYVNNPDKIDAAVEAVKAIDHPVAQSIEILLVICAYAGSGNVLQIQRLLREAATRVYEDDDDEDDDEENSQEAASSILAALSADKDAAMPDLTRAADGDDAADATAQAPDSEAQSPSAAQPPLPAQPGEPAADAAPAEEPKKKEDPAAQHESAKVKALCTLGVALVAMGENIGEEMVLRHLEHLMHYGDSFIKQAVPLAIGLLYTSNPQMKVYETLSRYTHESDLDVAANAIFAMGLVGAGTLNARIAQLLRQLDDYHARQSDLLFMVRFALGLVNLGKGTQTLSPFTSEKQLLSPVALSGLLVVAVGLLMPPTKQFMLAEHPSLFFSLALAIQPRMIVTVDEDLQPIKVTVRIGQAVDTVGQAGKPKRITGWVTQDTPVLISAGERAELESDEYEPLSSVLEGVVILRKKEPEN